MKGTLYKTLMALCVTFVVAGTGLLVGLWAVPQWDAYRAEMQVSSLQTSSTASSSTPEGSESLSQAHEYNASLAGDASSSSSKTYDEQLTAVDAEAISWLHIPSINVRRPVYHYDNERVLMQGLGHIEGTSLPVGGESTHCCVTGHSGMLGSRMFDDLSQMRIGDVFVFWTLGDPYAYRVYDIEIVLPDMTSSLYIQRGRDLATLITCTPYGINSHRLLVHGERTEYIPEEITATGVHPTSNRLWVLVLGIVAAAIGVGMLLYALLGGSTLKLATIAGATRGVIWQSGKAVQAGGGQGGASSPPGSGSGGMKIVLKPFGRTEVNVDGASFKTRWHYDGNDIIVDLRQGGLVEHVPAESGGEVDVQIPEQIRLRKDGGAYVAEAIVGDGPGTLTFEK